MEKEYSAILQEAQRLKEPIASWVNKMKKKRPSAFDDLVHNANDEAFEKIDCLKCANCCKTTSPLLTNVDIDRLAKGLKMKPSAIIEQYTKVDEDNDLVMNRTPCPFLAEDNYCMVYNFRPIACRDYPHTRRKNMLGFLNLAQKNASICPAVASIFLKLMKSADT